LVAGAAAIPSSFHKGGTGVDVLKSKAFSIAEDVSNEDEDEEDLPHYNTATTAALGD
jgi:hypothetical protein